MRTRFLKHINMLLLMLVTGVFWGTWFTMTRSISAFSAGEFIHIGKVIIGNIATPMQFLMPLTILLLLVNTWYEYRRKSRALYILLGSSFLMIGTLLITVMVEVPIANTLMTWSASTVPDNWERIRAKWAWYHGLRTIASIASFALFSFGEIVMGNFRLGNSRQRKGSYWADNCNLAESGKST